MSFVRLSSSRYPPEGQGLLFGYFKFYTIPPCPCVSQCLEQSTHTRKKESIGERWKEKERQTECSDWTYLA